MGKKKKGCLSKVIATLVTVVVLLVVVYVGLGVGDYYGLFVSGKYKTEKDLLGNRLEINLKIGGKFDEESIYKDLSWRAVGDKIYVFEKDDVSEEWATIQNGVLSFGEDGLVIARYYKDGDTKHDPDERGFLDKFRNIFKPMSRFCQWIEDKTNSK